MCDTKKLGFSDQASDYRATGSECKGMLPAMLVPSKPLQPSSSPGVWLQVDKLMSINSMLASEMRKNDFGVMASLQRQEASASQQMSVRQK